MSRILLVFCLLIFCADECLAQLPANAGFYSNLRIKKISTAADSIIIDTLSIVPNTFQAERLDSTTYSLDLVNAILKWKQQPAIDSVTIQYRVFDRKLNAAMQRMRFDSIAGYFQAPPFVFNNNGQEASFFETKGIQYTGSFGRSLAFGNRQDAVVNSNFQLQLAGMLKDSIEVAAALTDNNIPIQPDGTTQQLNEFDQVYLQFKKRNWQLSLGDIDIRQTDNRYLNFYKRLQGIAFETKNHLSPQLTFNTKVSGSIAKGKFTRNVFQGLEGNQGPYRLTGANNEFFFIVLANTERLFIDGELLQRGEDADYIINYNTAEVTFMPRRMITKDSRIQVEFEYADRNYLNANLFLSQQFSFNDRLKINVATYNNSDAKNSQINQSLDNRQKQFLFTIGDSISKAFYPAVIADSFAAGKILYEKVYVNNAGMLDSFYRYSTDPAVAKYALNFTDVGAGNGNYVSDFNGANGKIFRYIAPANGLKQGRFEPVIYLVTPKKHQIVTIGADYKLSGTTSISTAMAMSNYDQNTFSPKRNFDHQGFAGTMQLSNAFALNRDGLRLSSQLSFEHVQETFKPVERLRSVEFGREWGLPLILTNASETILKLSSQLSASNNRKLSYQLTNYKRSDNYNGWQHLFLQTGNYNGWEMTNQLGITQFETATSKGNFLRPLVDISKPLKQLNNLRAGFRYALEKSEITDRVTDSLSPMSFAFDTYTAYLKTDDAKKNKYALQFFTRSDKHPLGKQLQQADRSYNVNLQASLLSNAQHQLLLNTTYRVLQVYNKAISPHNNDRTLLGRAEYMVNEWKGLLTGNILYELGTGQEQRRDFAYLEVPAGQGEFTWIDYNADGIQQINEFEVAIFRDQAKYIRIFTPTNNFTKANYNSFNYSFSINPKTMLNNRDDAGFAKLLGRMQLQTSMQKTRKSIAKGGFELNPFKYSLLDTSLLTNNTSLLNNLSFNRFHTGWGFDISNVRNSAKTLLTYGYESRLLNDWILKARWNINSSVNLDVVNKSGNMALYTPGFSNRNYAINTLSTEPKLSYIFGTVFRLQGSYKWEQKLNDEQYGGEQATSHAISLETKYNVPQSSSLQGKFTYNNISFEKDPSKTNPGVEYIMMEALRPGSNYLWSLDFTRRLMNNVEINFQYEGRRPSNVSTIHTGRASIRALF